MPTILHLSNTFIPEDSRILRAIKSGCEGGYDVVGIGLMVPEKQHAIYNEDTNGIISIKIFSKKLKHLPRLLVKSFEVVEIILRLSIIGFRQKPDIIHCHDLPVLPTAILIKIFSSAKLIYDAHELSSQRNGLTKIEQRLIYYAEVISWPFINVLIVVSSSIQNWYAQNHKPKLIEIVYNSPQIKVLRDQTFQDNYFQNKFKIPKDHKVFIYLGYLCQGRGLEMLIDTFKTGLSKSHLVIIGYGPLEKRLKVRGEGSGNIHFHEAVRHEAVVPLSRVADYGFCMIEPISLSDKYCLPNKLFEYAFASLPVIASDLPDINKMVTQYGLGVCIPNDPSQIYELLFDIENRNVCVETRGIDLYNLSIDAQSKKIISLYRSLLNSQGRG